MSAQPSRNHTQSYCLSDGMVIYIQFGVVCWQCTYMCILWELCILSTIHPFKISHFPVHVWETDPAREIIWPKIHQKLHPLCCLAVLEPCICAVGFWIQALTPKPFRRMSCPTHMYMYRNCTGWSYLGSCCTVCCTDFEATRDRVMKNCLWCVSVGPKEKLALMQYCTAYISSSTRVSLQQFCDKWVI